MSKIKVQDGQSLVDIAIQTTGSIEGLVTLAFLNGKTVTSRLRVGEELEIPPVLNKDVVTFFQDRAITVGSDAEMYFPPILFAQNTLTFDEILEGQTDVQPIVVKNVGADTLTVTSIAFSSPAFSADVASFVLAPEAETTVNITFAPTTGGNFDSTLTFYCNTVETCKVVDLVASAIAITRIISITPSTLAFGTIEVGVENTLQFDIENTGNTALNVTSISLPFAVYSTDWSAGSISPSGTQPVMVSFEPTSAGNFDGVITVNSNATSGTNTLNITATATDFVSYGVFLDGSNDYARVVRGGTSDYSLSLWVNLLTSNTGFKNLIASQKYSSSEIGDGIALYYRGGNLEFYIKDGAYSPVLFTVAISGASLVHVALVKDGLNFEVFINGVSAATTTVAGTFSDTSANWFFGDIPGHGLANRLNAILFDFREFNLALSDAQILGIYNNTIPSGQVQRLKFDSVYASSGSLYTPATTGTDGQLYGYVSGAKCVVNQGNQNIQVTPTL